jgi:hypothetical protein
MENNPFDKLDKTFNTDPSAALEKNLREVKETTIVPVDDDKQTALHNQQLENDFQDARETLQKAAEYSQEAIEGILHVAKHTDHPRAYEVAGQLIKGMQENAATQMAVQEKQRKMKYGGKEPVKTQNNVFVGSTSELLKALKAEKPVN